MRLFRRLLTVAVVTCLFVVFCSQLRAAEVLVNGGFETAAGVANWNVTQSIVGDQGALVNAYEQLDIGDIGYTDTSGFTGLGLLVKSFAGNTGDFAGQNKMVNLAFSQTYAPGISAVGRTYTFTAHSLFQLNSSNNLETLGVLTTLGDYNQDTVVNSADYTIWRNTLGSTEDFRANGTNEGASLDTIDQADYDYWAERFGNAGHGAIPSPTQTRIEIAFLKADDTPSGPPAQLVLPKNRTSDMRPDAWQTHTLVAPPAPANTTKVRVSAIAENMIDSCTTCAGPGGKDVFFDNFTLRDGNVPGLERLVNGNLNTPGTPVGFMLDLQGNDNIQFSSEEYAIHTGLQGLWLRTFQGGNAKALQTVPGTAGTPYTFSTWAKIQPGYIGLDPTHPEVETRVTMEFLNGTTPIGSPVSVNIDDTGTYNWPVGMDNQGVWQQITLPQTVAPVGTTNVRISVGAINMASSGVSLPQGVMFDDLSLTTPMAGAGGFAVPEPSSGLMLISVVVGLLGVGRRRM